MLKSRAPLEGDLIGLAYPYSSLHEDSPSETTGEAIGTEIFFTVAQAISLSLLSLPSEVVTESEVLQFLP